MSTSSKTASAPLLRMMIYSRPLHPELFRIEGRRSVQHGGFKAELWLTAGGHVARFQALGRQLAEVVIDGGEGLPESGLVHALPAIGEKDYEMPASEPLGFVTTVQTETLSDNLYQGTLREMTDFAREVGALSYAYTDAAGRDSLSLIDCQKYKRELHLQAYHLLGGSGVVLRTQSIFEMHA
ncbi:hypothetical protein [Phycisphaera mikurensis]|uniref:DUF2617 family protein n=1 Tax=Phycisphaera mikurensis (strain NBRC 102666 / KCTC 22515 / FYK2301M01) TaxID=1142394 RepID=I0IBQ0_PHYMF|nr:hypothetical protein [Phycisphaera mikurensis]MBB6443384.1 hypothetical protein [Phycisphaera mikurensis]BAM02688.1 hypothetical protein PSMK_05290 [Phycisphaera mikurensis NBRC 102666]